MLDKSPCYITEFCCVVEFFICFSRLAPVVVIEVRSQEGGGGRVARKGVNAYADLEEVLQLWALSGGDAVRACIPSTGQDVRDLLTSRTLPYNIYTISPI